MPRTILVHLNVEVPDGDDRPVEEIESALKAALEVGSDADEVADLDVTFVLAEEV